MPHERLRGNGVPIPTQLIQSGALVILHMLRRAGYMFRVSPMAESQCALDYDKLMRNPGVDT